MSDDKPREFFEVLETSFDVSSEVLRDYTVSSVIKPKYGGSFVRFLDKNKHDYYHKVSKHNLCCRCKSNNTDKSSVGFIKQETFYKFYFKDNSIHRCQDSKSTNGAKFSCLCQILSVQNKKLEDFDQSDLFCMLLQCKDFDMYMTKHIEALREVRNTLCHSPTTKSLNSDELNELWVKMKDATLALAEDISSYLHKLIKSKFDTPPKIDSAERIEQVIKEQVKGIEQKLGNKIKKLEKIVTGSLRRKPSKCFSINAKVRAKMKQKTGLPHDDNKTVTAVVNSTSLDETKVIQKMSEVEATENKEDKGCCSKSFNITNIEHHCIRFDLEASPELFSNEELLNDAVDDFINKLLEAGEVDINTPGTIDIEFIVQSELSEEEILVVQSVFSQEAVCLDEANETEIQQSPGVEEATHSQRWKKKHLLSESSTSEDEQTNIKPLKREFKYPVKITKSSLQGKRFKQDKGFHNTLLKDTDDTAGSSILVYLSMTVETQSHTFTLNVVDIPEHLARFERMPEAESNRNICLQWSFACPSHWTKSDLVEEMNKKLLNLKGWFRPVLIFQDKETKRLILQCNTQCQLFSSRHQFELEVRNFIELIEDKCQLQTYSQTHGDKREDVGISLSVIMPPDGYLLEDDPKNLISEAEKEPVHGKRTDLDKTLLRLGVKQCLEIKYKEYSKTKTQYYPITVKSAFYSHLKELVRKRKRSLSLSTRKVIQSIQSNLSQAVSKFPELDLFDADKYSYSCGNCSSSDVICWCKICDQLYCFYCLTKHHKDFSHDFKLDDKPCPALTFINKYYIRYEKEQIIHLYDMEVLNGKLIILGKFNRQLKLVLWKDDVLDSKLVDDNHDEYVNCRIAVIDSYTCAVQTKMFIIIFTINNSMINEVLRIQMDEDCCSLAYANGILYVGTGSGIVKMALEGNIVGEIKCENLKALYANGTQIYYTTYGEGQYVNVIDTTKSDTIRSLDSFRTSPDHMDFTSNGNIVFSKRNNIWFTSDEGQCNYILIGLWRFEYKVFVSQSNDDIYFADTLYDGRIYIGKYKFDEEMLTQLTQSMSQLSTSSGTSFQKSVQDPEISPVTTDVSVPLTSVSIAQTTTAEEQGGVVNPDIETLPVRESYLPFTPLQTFPPGEEPYHQQRESSEGFQPFSPQSSYSDVAFRQFYSNPGPSQPSYFAPPVHTYGRPPHLPPGDDVITSDDDLSDESWD